MGKEGVQASESQEITSFYQVTAESGSFRGRRGWERDAAPAFPVRTRDGTTKTTRNQYLWWQRELRREGESYKPVRVFRRQHLGTGYHVLRVANRYVRFYSMPSSCGALRKF